MNIKIVPISEQNREECLALRVANGQEGFVETVGECLKEAEVYSVWRPSGIYDGNKPVGFAMYGLWEREGYNGRVWLDRFFIDGRYQGQGLGKEALGVLVSRLREEYGRDEIYLSLYEENEVAAGLYLRFGFTYNGELDINGEKVMVLK